MKKFYGAVLAAFLFSAVYLLVFFGTSFGASFGASGGALVIPKEVRVYPKEAARIGRVIERAAPGDTIYFGAGRYYTRNTIYIIQKRGLLLKAHPKAYFVLNNLDGAVFAIEESDNIALEKIRASHREPIRPGEVCSGAVISVRESHDISIVDADLNGSGTMGLAIENSVNVSISNSRLHGNSVAAIGLYGFVDGISIVDNIFSNNPQLFDTTLTEDEMARLIHFTAKEEQ